MKKYIKNYEWELLQDNLKIDDLKIDDLKIDGTCPSSYIPENIKNVEIYRDDLYNLNVLLTATEDSKSDKRTLVADKMGKIFTTNISRFRGSQEIELKNCYISSVKRISTKNSFVEEVNLIIPIGEVKIKKKSNTEPIFLIDWYLNGPEQHVFPRFTNREITLNYERIRKSTNGSDICFKFNEPLSQGSLDFAYINTGNVKFLISKVNTDFGPSWSKNIGIEFRTEYGIIPDLEQRKVISEIISFIFGKQLIHVGYTVYGANGEILEQYSASPHIDNLIYLCQKPNESPIYLKLNTAFNIENILNKLIPNYLILRDELNLEKALLLYWTALNTPIGIDLPIYSSALELIVNSWFKSTKSKIKGLYMEKQEFERLLSEELSKIEEILMSKEFGVAIANKMKNSNQMSVSDRFTYFFKEIDLKVGDIENKAIKARNPSAHGSAKWNDESFEKMNINAQAYKTLLNRVILKLLDYEEYYIDWSTHNSSPKKIDVPLGGRRVK
ncbi:hypothetical protein [Methanosarcina acetivorans]|uniref:ApeA N-terminal domain-containing protein n=1 Tax=Methanosarcina acetivorans (strain ATCC 35395 / DSM 2834 / JCM 12185 / C2A) TaxID=188937 RepID=Q8TMQ2_METAC|nr:hypothetical protein [Methanosarcina acetivorans]AAM05982.1 predicted protein [Methanosarcina acetivorans C2A]